MATTSSSSSTRSLLDNKNNPENDDDARVDALLRDEPDTYERESHSDVEDDSDYYDDDDDDVPHARPEKPHSCSCASGRCRTLAGFAIMFGALALFVTSVGCYALGVSLRGRADAITASGWTERVCVVLGVHSVYANASHIQALANESVSGGGDDDDESALSTATQLCTWTTVKLDGGDDTSACGVPSYIARHSTGSGACFDVTETHRRPMPRVNERRRCLWPSNVAAVSPRECTLGVLDTSTYSRIVHAELRRFVYLFEDAAEARAVVETATHELRVLGIAMTQAGIVALLMLLFTSCVLTLLCVTRARVGVLGYRVKVARD